jgi:hypothetical protein
MAISGNLSYVINHVFLPPKLPQVNDSNFEMEFNLGKQCEAALELFQTHLSAQTHSKWATCAKMLKNLLALRRRGDMELDEVGRYLGEMEINGITASL